MSSHEHKSRPYLVNPAEIVVFGVVALLFFNSVYELFYDWRGAHVQESTLAKIENDFSGDIREPASVAPPSFANIEIQCGDPNHYETSAERVRLSGPICGLSTASKDQVPTVRTQIHAPSTSTNIALYADPAEGTFLTDYIVVEPGENKLEVIFTLLSPTGEKSIHQNIVVTRK